MLAKVFGKERYGTSAVPYLHAATSSVFTARSVEDAVKMPEGDVERTLGAEEFTSPPRAEVARVEVEFERVPTTENDPGFVPVIIRVPLRCVPVNDAAEKETLLGVACAFVGAITREPSNGLSLWMEYANAAPLSSTIEDGPLTARETA